jgi:integrase
MKTVSGNQRLLRCKGVYYYRRRVPLHLVEKLGRKVVQLSLNTASFKEAKQLRAIKDLEWDARFHQLEANDSTVTADTAKANTAKPPLPESELLRLVREYVERKDSEAQNWFSSDPPYSECQKAEMIADVQMEAQITRDRDDPQADEWISMTGKEILEAAGRTDDEPGLPWPAFAEMLRRALLELDRRHLARLHDNHERTFFDQLFDPSYRPTATFGGLAEQVLQLTQEEAETNGTSQKWVDKQHAIMALIREIVQDPTPVGSIDYDTCLRVRSTLARVPANRTKIYGGLPIDQAIARAAAEGKQLLSPVTQQQYLAAFRDVLDLALKKRLIPANPAEGLKPVKRDSVAAAEKRKPFTTEQLKSFFHSKFYSECAKHPLPFAHDKTGWRFWLPLICLFMGMRPNEAAQMLVSDLKQTSNGIWYLDITATTDDDEDNSLSPPKTLKTAHSRRKIPLHPQLIAIGFLQFVEMRKNNGVGLRLFPELKPDKYGNHASYALKRFRDSYLPHAIKLEPKQSFYSFRHTWRDALRRIDAQPATLQALGAWSQGKLVSDDYGDKSDPDYQAKFMMKVGFPGVHLFHLCVSETSKHSEKENAQVCSSK